MSLTVEGNLVIIDGIRDGVRRGSVEIGNDGVISRVSDATGQADIVFKDELIFPGFIDLHVHARECADHSQDYKEDFISAGQAAINGGVVAFADMPNNPVPPIDDASYEEKLKLTKKSAVDILLYAGIGPKTSPLSLRAPYKVYMGKSVGNLFFENYEDLANVLGKYKGDYVSFHCEDPKILEANKNQNTHELRRPVEAELSAVEFALDMVERYGIKGKICHVSSANTLGIIRADKESPPLATVEVTPHHLYFDETMMNESNHNFFQVNPPIRQSRGNRMALIEALKNGEIDYLATDHAPHSIDEKEKGMSGLTHLDTYGCFVTWLMKEHNFTPLRIAEICSFSPGLFLTHYLPYSYGRIKPGFIGSLTILDTNRKTVISKSKLKTKAGWSPFEGITFPGAPIMTIVKGKLNKTLWQQN